MVVHGEVVVPGDKSITHRVLLIAGLIRGTSRIRGALTSFDARSTGRFLRKLHVGVSALRADSEVRVQGSIRWRAPTGPIHCGNSGTTTRLGLGLLAAQPISVALTGDGSLRRRPMRRVTLPLVAMGAKVAPADRETLPLTIRGGRLRGIRWELPVSSAQIKSAVLLAGLAGGVEVSVREPGGRSRDHTERLLRGLGVSVEERGGWIHLSPPERLHPFEYEVPGDPSSAAFLVGAAVLAESGELVIRNVGVNPTRTGFLRVLERMGGRVGVVGERDQLGEPVADLVARPSALRGTTVAADEIPGLIDEIPLLAVLAARASGTTVFHEVGELRVKESDRLALIAENLRSVGVLAEAQGNTLVIEGTDATPRGRIRTDGDHRIAMAFAVLGTVPGARVRVDDLACAAVSFPNFPAVLRRAGGGRPR
ncbi:MAG: 3-phosphoshikimate 1-carboxyvinyltransferase [Gemmatimonadota bacterium]